MNLNEERIYTLHLSKICVEACSYCPGLGYKSDEKDLSEIQQSLVKAQSGEYTALLLPCNFLFRPDYKEAFELLQKSQFKIILNINSRSFTPQWIQLLKGIEKFVDHYLVTLDFETNNDPLACIGHLERQPRKVSYLYIGNFDLPLMEALKLTPEDIHPRLYLYYPYKLSGSANFLSTNEIQRQIAQTKKDRPNFQVKTLSGLDNFEPRAAEGITLEPTIEPLWEQQSVSPSIRYSVVIPSYNNKYYLTNTLRHLFQQNISPNDFEVIVVDDGSDDSSADFVFKYFQGQKINFRYIYFPRPKARQMGDGQFRAGIARNLGVKRARGELLIFLDSDILTPKDYIQRLAEEHETWDVIQTERQYLKEEVSGLDTNYYDIDRQKDIYIPEDGYWEEFYRDPTPWSDRACPWKYACTYALSMKTEAFKKVGWFKKNYIFYGFEDTDLGYRLMKRGYSQHKSSIRVFHLFHETKRSEFKNSAYLRHELLKRTAKIFYHQYLDPEIYKHLSSLVAEKPSFRERLFPKKRRFKYAPGIESL